MEIEVEVFLVVERGISGSGISGCGASVVVSEFGLSGIRGFGFSSVGARISWSNKSMSDRTFASSG